MLSEEEIDNILNFWFPNNEYNKFWFAKNGVIDKYIFDNYYKLLLDIYEKYKFVEDFRFITNKNELLAGIILLDQFSRNISRIEQTLTGEKINEMTSLARMMTFQWITLDYHIDCNINKLVFVLMPLRHLNNITDYKLILCILETIKDKENDIYKKFLFHTKKRLQLF
jgi:uncharacterized protein (DUF924 family)